MDHKLNNIIRDGMKRLPPGFRFQPTDEELVFEYLKRKVLSSPLPASMIPDINLYKFDPWDLPGDMEHERYFFSNQEAKYPNGNRINRATASGYWKATGVDKQIGSSSSRNNNHAAVGMRKTLVFYRGKPPHASRTDWIMHEFRILSVGNTAYCNYPLAAKNSSQKSLNQLENWVLCKIFFKDRSTETTSSEIINQTCSDRKVRNVVVGEPIFFDFMKRDRIIYDSVSSSSSSSSSSGITVVSTAGEDCEESRSSRRSFF